MRVETYRAVVIGDSEFPLSRLRKREETQVREIMTG